MRIHQAFRAPAIAAALVALTAAGCDRGAGANDGMSTEVNLSDDAAANDVLGGNDAEAIEASPSATTANSES